MPEFVERRNKTECDLWLMKDGQKLRPKFAVGGGVRDIVSFALRLSYWRLEKSSPVMILDEPFKNLSRNLIPKAVDTLKYLSNKFNLQMIIVTHIPELAEQADRLFEVEQGQVQQITGG
jgi:DNA repair exonuclease SbcCD ATPase subunit